MTGPGERCGIHNAGDVSNAPGMWSIDRAIDAYGCQGFARSTQKWRFGVLKRQGLLGQPKPQESERPVESSAGISSWECWRNGIPTPEVLARLIERIVLVEQMRIQIGLERVPIRR